MIRNKLIGKKICAVVLSAAMVLPAGIPAVNVKADAPTVTYKDSQVLSYEGYTKKWEDEFEGDSLNRDDWNVEVHEPGWVNSEWQAYVDEEDSKNIVVKDGKLYLIPKKEGEGENATYTSGRVNTMGKHDFKYGLFETTVKVPKGKGYLPAFWMMPTNENLYGQWPKCGEIDAMEVMGQDVNKLYGTLHYGEPHGQQQGTATIKDGEYIAVEGPSESLEGNYAIENGNSYADEFHTYAVEWEPNHISWYVDGIKYHEVNDWFSAVDGGDEVAYPAPFDQPFYMILNLAVGGSWVGYPDETTTYGEQSAFVIDSVKVYQKSAAYYEQLESTVNKPEKVITWREADQNGNYVVNGNFAEAINSKTDWTLHLESDATGSTSAVSNNSIKITPSAIGEQKHSVQLKQEGIPLYRGVEYTLSFKAKAESARSIIVDVEGPDRGWKRYLNDTTVALTTESQTFSYDFTMNSKSDANSSLEFNLGKQGSKVPVTISDVSIKIKDDSGKIDESTYREVRSDGNYVYNGSFSEGSNLDRTKYWTIAENDKAYVSVTNTNNQRRLKVVAPEGTTTENPLVIKQDNLPLLAGKYAISYKAYKEGATENDKSLVISVGQAEFSNELTEDEKSYDGKFEFAENDANTIKLSFTAPGTYYVDDVFVSEDALVKNGKFNAGIAGYTQYTYDSAKAEYTIDSQKEENAFDITISDTGTQDWHVQLYQDGINLEKGKFYRLKFDAKSELLDRNITCVIQKNGSLVTPEDWSPYFTTIKAGLTSEWKTFTKDFQMKNDSDPVARLGFAMGKIDEQITTPHRVFIDNISLVEIGESEADIEKPEVPTVEAHAVGENLLENDKFESENGTVSNWVSYLANWEGGPGAAADISAEDGKIDFDISDVGTADWNIQLKQTPIALKAGEKYEVSFKVKSDVERNIMWGVQHNGGDTSDGGDGSGDYLGYCGGNEIAISSEEKLVKETFVMDKDDTFTTFYVSMGKMASGNNAVGKVTISEPVLKRVDDTLVGQNILENADFSADDAFDSWNPYLANWEGGPGADADITAENGSAVFDISNVGTDSWNVQLKQTPITLVKGVTYRASVKLSSSTERKVMWGVQHNGGDTSDGGDGSGEYSGYCGGEAETVGTEGKVLSATFKMNDDDDFVTFYVSMGKVDNETTPISKITISEPSIVRVDVEKEEADAKAAKAVETLIKAIGDVVATDECKAAIDAASEAYDKLSDEQKALLDDKLVKKLEDAKTAYTDAKAAADKKEEPKEEPKSEPKQEAPKTTTPAPTPANDNGNGVVEVGEKAVTEQGTFTAISDKAVAFAPSEEAKNAKTDVIPDTVKIDGVEVPVTTVAENAYKDSAVKEVTLGKNITSISASAFENAKKLTKVKTKTNKITTIGKNAFAGASSLKNVDLSKQSNLTTIGDYAFEKCKNLVNIKVNGNKLKKVSKKAFKGAKNKKSVKVTIVAKSDKKFKKVVKMLKKAGLSKATFKRKKK
ncbi:MAG: carbohydrate binding domain-containing protein [Lachnospiraceae bacterium]|nr:carbohydrate binding domain-containing protein [Lachnospiraceae bacterium]